MDHMLHKSLAYLLDSCMFDLRHGWVIRLGCKSDGLDGV